MTFKGATTRACAACRFQRKRCTADCALAPHFRPEQPVLFKNAHKLFGVRNILRILEKINQPQKTEAMRSIIYEANMRDRFPVHGCLGVIYELHYQIRQAEEELHNVLFRLAVYKQHHHHHERQQEIALWPDDSRDPLQSLCMANEALTRFWHQAVDPNTDMCNVLCLNKRSDHDNKRSMTTNDLRPLIIQEEVVHDYDEIYPFFDNTEDRQSYVEENESRHTVVMSDAA